MDVPLRENERIDDLERNGYRIIQNRNRFCFGMDAVLLSCFAAEGEKKRSGKKMRKVADLGTGTGVIPILLCGRFGTPDQQNLPETLIDALEIQEEMCDMASRSVRLNDLQSRIHIRQGDICNAAGLLGKGLYDVVVSNPPYKKRGGGLVNPDDSKAISRHEVLCTFEDVAVQAAALLKNGGRFYLVHRPERLAQLISTMNEAGFQLKRMRMVHSFPDTRATMVLIEATLGGGEFLEVERPLIIYQKQGVYTDEIREIYYF